MHEANTAILDILVDNSVIISLEARGPIFFLYYIIFPTQNNISLSDKYSMKGDVHVWGVFLPRAQWTFMH